MIGMIRDIDRLLSWAGWVGLVMVQQPNGIMTAALAVQEVLRHLADSYAEKIGMLDVDLSGAILAEYNPSSGPEVHVRLIIRSHVHIKAGRSWRALWVEKVCHLNMCTGSLFIKKTEMSGSTLLFSTLMA